MKTSQLQAILDEITRHGLTVNDVPDFVGEMLASLVLGFHDPVTIKINGEPLAKWWAARQTDAVQEAFKRERNCHRDLNYRQMVQIVQMWNRTCYSPCVDFVQKVTKVTLTEATDFVLAQWT